MSYIGKGLLLCFFVIAVSASVTEKLLKIPLFEVGEIWLSSVYKLNAQLFEFLLGLIDIYSYKFYILLTAGSVASYYLYKLFFEPLDRIRVLGDIGYLSEKAFTLKEISNSVKRRRMVGEIPPVYPNGWFGLIEGFRIKKGEVTNISALGQQLAVFRDEKGESHVLDAYCPHMGANIAVGGRVVGDCLECPFHGWQFRGADGKVTKIPYADKIPDMARVKSWPSMEINGWVYLWHNAEGVDPTWLPPELEEITKGNWQFSGRSEHYINSHIEEVPENGADVAHLYQVHTPFMLAGINLATMWNKYFSFACHKWTASWQQNPAPEEHIGSLELTHNLSIFGKSIPPVALSVFAKQIGPGIVYLEFESFFGKGVFIQSLTPAEPMVQKLVHNLYMHWAVPNIITKFFMYGEAVQVERDVMIWNNKKYCGKPVFVKCKEDSLIARHRRWYSQFYSENSPKLSFQKDSLEW